MGPSHELWTLSNSLFGIHTVAEFYLYGGMFLLGCSAALHYFLYLRLRDTGRNYIIFNLLWPVLSDYLRITSKQRWSPWPAYLVLPTMVVGFVLLCMGVFKLP
jgi:hypothetical protein